MGKANRKVVVILAVVVTVLAVVLARRGAERSGGEFQAGRLFPELEVGRVARVELLQGEAAATLEKVSETTWGLAERSGYPVDAERLRGLVLSVAGIEVVDRLTDNPEKYDRLGVGEAPEGGRLKLLDPDGAVLVDLRVGKGREVRGGQGAVPGEGQFLRVEGDPAVYAGKATLLMDTDPARWLRREILKVPAQDVRRFHVTHADPKANFAAARAGAEDPFQLETPPPAGKRLRSGTLAMASRALANLELDDVLPADGDEAAALEFGDAYEAVTASGVSYRVELAAKDAQYYVRVSAAAGEPPPAEPEGKAEGAEEGAAAPAEPVEDPKAVAEEVNERHAGWVYRVPSFAYDSLAKKLPDLLEDEKSE